VINSPLRLVFDVADGALQREIERCEADVFTAFFGNSEQELAAEYGAYPGVHWLGVLDSHGRAVAASRIFLPVGERTKTMDDVERVWGVDPEEALDQAGVDPDLTVDVGTFAVRPGMAQLGAPASRALLYGLFSVVRANSCASITLILDTVPDALLTAGGLQFQTLPGTTFRSYLGSPSSRPVFCFVDEMLAGQRRLSPPDYRACALGLGLDPIRVPPLSEFQVPGYGAGRQLPA